MKFTERITSTAKLFRSLGLAMLLFCFAPVHAQSEGFKSTSAYQLNASVQNPNAVNQYNAYRSTIYQPFSESAPSSNSPSRGPSKINDRRNAVIGIPDWGDTMSEPLPIGDTVPLFLFAAAMIAIIYIKQRKQKQIITQTNNNSDNNSTTHMTTTKQTYPSFFQKLFLLLTFVCIAGQVSGQQSRRLYFRPSTILVSNNSGSSTIAWAKASTGAWFPMLGNKDDVYANRKWHYLDSYTSVKIYSGDQSRFLAYTADTDTYKFAFYRVNDGTAGAIYKDLLKYVTQQGSTANIDKGVFNCIPNNDWYTNSSQYWNSQMISLPDLGAHNLICIKEGSWTNYYYAYYIDNTVNLYFANTTNWDTPIFARGKDVYSYKHSSTNITGTKLYYTQLVKESGIAYTDYAYIDGTTGSWDEQTTLWKNYKDTWVAQSTINQNTLTNRIANFTKRSAIVTDHCLDDKRFENNTEVSFHVFTPGTNVGDPLTKQSLSSYADLNKKLTIKVSSVGDGTITCNTYKLTGEGVSQPNTLTVSRNQKQTTGDAAYTADVTLIATPRTDYEFVGWYAGTNAESLISTEQTYKTTKTNSESTITAKFQPILISQTVAVEIEGGGTGCTARVNYTDGTSNRVQSGTNINFQPWMNSQYTVTVGSIKEGYIFAGWYYNGELQSTDQTYIYTASIDGATITARFALPHAEHAIALLTYDPTYNEYKPVNPGGSVTYTTKKANGSQLETVSNSTETATTFTAASNQTVTLKARARQDYDFIGFYEGETLLAEGGEKAQDYTYTYTATTKGRYITARFAPKQCHPIILVPNSAGTYTIRFGMDKDNPENFYSKESSLTDTVITYAPYSYYYTVSSAKPILGYKFKHHDASPKSTNANYWDLGKYHNEARTDTSYVVVSFVRDEEQVVYLDLNGKWNRTGYDKYWVYAYDTTNILGVNDGKGNVKNGTYKWIPMTKSTTADSLYSCTIPRDKYSHIMFVQLSTDQEPPHPIESYKGQNLNHTKFFTIPATRYNCMRLQWSWNSTTSRFEDAWTDAPTEEGDYRLIYIEQTVISDDSIRIDYDFSTNADLIKKRASGKDIVSLHIYNKVSDGFNGMNNPEIILQRCTGFANGKSQWKDVERHLVFGPLRFEDAGSIRMPRRKNATVVGNLGIPNIINSATPENDYACGVWNFTIQQDEDGTSATLLLEETEEYKGNYYIRTTNAPGQYNNYTHPGNVISESEYAKNHSNYSHYYIRDVNINEDGTATGEAGKHPLVKFAIANDYARFLNYELLIEQKRFADDNYTDVFVKNNDGSPNLPADASVRFGWDIVTNRLTRAYIANTTIKNNEYLVVEGANIGNPSGDDAYFTDNSNWLYSIDLPNATAGAAAKVKAKMNGNYQYFVGTEQTNETLISGNGEGTYPIRLLYDFKDDRLTTIYHPQGTISGTTNLQTPVMIEREHNNAPTQIQFTNAQTTIKATGTGEDQYTHPAYAVMTFLGNILTDPAITHHEKMFYWVSFPFNVKIEDIFGLGDYGQYWIMQYYDGKQRDDYGLKYTNWQYILDTDTILNANQGYIICLNYGQLVTDGIATKDNKLSLYFPSNGVVSPADIKQQANVKVTLTEYNSNKAWYHNNWHVIGVPSFATPGLEREQTEMPFLYEYWHPGDAYAAIANGEEGELLPMHSYMVQYAGDITWTSVVNTTPKSLAAKTSTEDKPVMLRLELQQTGNTIDKTFVQLRSDKGTLGFDLNLDLSKVINAGANIYSVVSGDQMAGNAIPKEETVIPIGVVITAAGEYTFAMPNGTGGMIVELIDYEQGTSTNLLAMDYTVNLPKATNNTRFALRLKPNKVATSLKNIGNGTTSGDAVRKLLIDGVLYLQKGNLLYDAQGRYVQ